VEHPTFTISPSQMKQPSTGFLCAVRCSLHITLMARRRRPGGSAQYAKLGVSCLPAQKPPNITAHFGVAVGNAHALAPPHAIELLACSIP